MASQTQSQPIHPKSFVTEEYDKFEDNRDVTFAWPDTLNNYFFNNFKLKDGKITDGYSFQMTISSSKSADGEGIILSYEYRGVDWGWVRDGKLIINMDGVTNIALEPKEAETNTNVNGVNIVQEMGYYLVSPEQLEAICNANAIEIKVTGAKFNFTLDNQTKQLIGGLTFPDKFLFMARAFYSGLYNDDSYLDHVKKVFGSTVAKQQLLHKQENKGKVIAVVIIILVLAAIGALVYFIGSHKTP